MDHVNELAMTGGRNEPESVLDRARTVSAAFTNLSSNEKRVLELADAGDGSVTLAQLRDALGTSRKFAQALLEHFDAEKVTIRRGDQHLLRRRGRAAV